MMKDYAAGSSAQARTLRRIQRSSFDYFTHERNHDKGLIKDKASDDSPASIAAVGMALSVYPVGVERRYIDRDNAARHTLATLRFFAQSEQSREPDATGYKGFYYHFLDMKSGKRTWDSELSSIDTAILLAGMLCVRAYFDGEDAIEAEIRDLAVELYKRADWEWMLAGQRRVCLGWKPDSGFLDAHWEGYSEALILYLLALGSPTHPVDADSYRGVWCDSYLWKKAYDIEYLYAGPLFIHQLSHIWCDFRGIRDRVMRKRDSDYFENSRRATLVHRQYAIHNPFGYSRLGKLCWGISACDGPGDEMKKVAGIDRKFFDYLARGAPYGPDDGTICPWVAAASLPFAPEIVAPTIHHLARLHADVPESYGFKSAFNPTFSDDPDDETGWVSPHHHAINHGPIALMVENHRSGLIWKLMRGCPYLVAGLKAAGFDGGWLDQA